MKILFSIVMAFLITAEAMLPGMDVHELTKLPDLLEHYHEHKKNNPEITVVAFLKLHYEDVRHHEQDHQNHHKLPLSNHHHQHNCNLHHVLFTIPDVTVSLAVEPLQRENKVVYKTPTELNFYGSIWQPPRIG